MTGFNIPIIELPFERKVDLEEDTKFKKNIQIIRRSLKRFNPEMLILLDQSSTHSLILKLRNLSLKGECETDKEKVVFEGINSFDIFDEVDALMTPKKSFVYSVGGHSKLDEDLLRF